MAPSHILQIRLRVTIQNQVCIAQRVIMDKIVQFRLLRHGHVQRILDPSAVDGDHSPIPENQLHAAGVHVIRCYYERGIVGRSKISGSLPVDIPTGWEPRAKQQPTGLIAYGATRRRPVQVL